MSAIYAMKNLKNFFNVIDVIFYHVLYVLITIILVKIANVHNVENNYLKNNILYINLKMKIIYFTLSIVSSLSYLYTYCIVKYISYFISIEIQIFF